MSVPRITPADRPRLYPDVQNAIADEVDAVRSDVDAHGASAHESPSGAQAKVDTHEALPSHLRVSEPPPVIHVSPTGDDAFDGRWDRPKLSPQVAADAVPNGGVVMLSGGEHAWPAAGIVVPNHRVHIVGLGPRATVVRFNPAAAASAIRFREAAAAVLFQNSVRGIGFLSDDTTFTKTAIELEDVSRMLVEDVSVTNWTGAGSTALRTKGREMGSIFRGSFTADKPLVISQNPNHSIDVDHLHFQDLILTANNEPCVTIESGVNLTQVTFDGYQSWNKGTYGLYWNDLATVGNSLHLRLDNIRTEQGQDPTKESIYVAHNSGLSHVSVRNAKLDNTRAGLYFRKCRVIELEDVFHAPTVPMSSLNAQADNTLFTLSLRGCTWSGNSTKMLTNYIERRMDFQNNSGGDFAAPPENAFYVYSGMPTTDPRQASRENGVFRFVWRGTIAAGATQTLPNSQSGVFAGKSSAYVARVTAHNSGVPVHLYGTVFGHVKPATAHAAVAVGASANFEAVTTGTGTAGRLSWRQGHSNAAALINNTANPLSVLVVIEYTLDSD